MNLEVFTQPFMLQSFYAGIIVALLLAILGVFVTLKEKSFLADGVAHASLAGIAIGVVFATQPLLFAMLVAVVMSIGITYVKRNTKLATDSLIGIFYTTFFALGIVVINFAQGYQPELMRYLFGSLLFVTWSNILLAFIVLAIVIFFVVNYYKQILYSTFDSDAAYIRGVKVHLLEYIVNTLISLAIIVSIKLVGIVLVSGLLIIPATTAKLFAKRFSQMIPFSVLFALLSVLFGIIFSYYLEAPSGAVIVLTASAIFLFSFIYTRIRQVN